MEMEVEMAGAGRRRQPPNPETGALGEEEEEQPLRGESSARELSNEDTLSVYRKLSYGIGGAPNQIASSAISFFLPVYLLDIALITPFYASLVFFIGKGCGLLADPIAGFFINKSKWTKFGQLMPWLLGCTPFLAVSYFLLWYLPSFTSERFVWCLTFYSLFQALSTVFQVAYSALTMSLTTDQKDRDSVTAYRMTFEILGTLVGAVLHGQIVASTHASDPCSHNHTTEHLYRQENISIIQDQSYERKIYMIAAGTIGGIYLVGIVALFFGVKEKVDLYALKTDRKISFWEGHRLALKHGPYVKFAASFFLISTAVQLEQGTFVLYCIHAADLHNHFQYLVMTLLVSATVSIPLWQFHLKHRGKKDVACSIWMLITAVGTLVMFPNPIVAYLMTFMSGMCIAASMLSPWSMLPDIVDHFHVQNPYIRGHETIFYTSYVFLTKISSGLGLGISSFTLDLAGYKPGICKQSNSVVIMLKTLIVVLPSILIISGLFILYFYPITEKSRKETKYALENLRKKYPSIEILPGNEEDISL